MFYVLARVDVTNKNEFSFGKEPCKNKSLYYRVAKMHRMTIVAGLFSQKSC